MNNLTVKDISIICNGVYLGDGSVLCSSYSKDTRLIKEGDTYIGIKGTNFDGNLFYKEAFLKGAICAILEKDSFVEDKSYECKNPIILVDNALEALKKLGIYIRNHSSAKFIGVTGSVGKTSTRDMIYSVVKQKYKSLKTEGNFNNNIGLPLTLLRLKDEEAAVIEMGMNDLGEIDYLSKIARPHISVITNIGTAHIGKLGSRENILKAKLEILNGMDQDGVLIINNDNDLLSSYAKENNEHSIVTIGIDNNCDYQAININLESDHSEFDIVYQDKICHIFCPVPGKAFVYNSLVAFATGKLLNICDDEIKKGINLFESTENRLDIFDIRENITIINDAYNASVDSMKSSLEILKNIQAERRIAVLGDMLELGEFSKKLHEEVGSFVVENKIDYLLTVGNNAKFMVSKAKELGMNEKNIFSFERNNEVISKLKEILKKGDAVLIKASNGLHFSEIVDELKKI